MTAAYMAAGPFTFESDPRWRWKAWGWVVDGRLWPDRVEVRYKPGECEHDTPPPGALTTVAEVRAAAVSTGLAWLWEPTPCTCWDGLDAPTPMDALPTGGLSSTMLRSVRLGDAGSDLQQRAESTLGSRIADLDDPDFAELVEQLAEPPRPSGPGRPPLPVSTQLRRLAALADAYDQGKTQAAAARRLKVSVETVRASLEWGRREGYWQQTGRGRRGTLTPKGRAAVAVLKGGKR